MSVLTTAFAEALVKKPWAVGYLYAAKRWQQAHTCCSPDDEAEAERAFTDWKAGR